MQLATPRLLIRDFIESDLDAVYAYGSDPEVVRYMPFPPSTLAGTREHIARCMALAGEQPRRWYDMGIVLQSTGQLIGGIALDVFDREHAKPYAAPIWAIRLEAGCAWLYTRRAALNSCQRCNAP
jgi:RimJ/RimL family protein N-acetyltransferase